MRNTESPKSTNDRILGDDCSCSDPPGRPLPDPVLAALENEKVSDHYSGDCGDLCGCAGSISLRWKHRSRWTTTTRPAKRLQCFVTERFFQRIR